MGEGAKGDFPLAMFRLIGSSHAVFFNACRPEGERIVGRSGNVEGYTIGLSRLREGSLPGGPGPSATP